MEMGMRGRGRIVGLSCGIYWVDLGEFGYLIEGLAFGDVIEGCSIKLWITGNLYF